MFVDDELVAVLVKLDGTHGDLMGHWYAEAAFNGLERMNEHTFTELSKAADWIRTTLA